MRSQSYEFESNSQHVWLTQKESDVVWGHKVTNLKATHNYDYKQVQDWFRCLRSQSYEFESNSQLFTGYVSREAVVWGHKVTNLKATHN